MKKLVFVIALVLNSIGMISAQTTSYSSYPKSYQSTYSTLGATNYNSTYSTGKNTYTESQTYNTGSRSTSVNTTRTSFGTDNSYLSGTTVCSNGKVRSSSRTSSIDLGCGSRMTTTNYYNPNGSVRKSRTKTTTIYGF